MIVCVPLFGNRVAPHFGSSPELQFYEVKQDRIEKRQTIELSTHDPMYMARKISENNPDVLVCGGIQNYCREWLMHWGIKVFANQKGEAREVIAHLNDSAL